MKSTLAVLALAAAGTQTAALTNTYYHGPFTDALCTKEGVVVTLVTGTADYATISGPEADVTACVGTLTAATTEQLACIEESTADPPVGTWTLGNGPECKQPTEGGACKVVTGSCEGTMTCDETSKTCKEPEPEPTATKAMLFEFSSSKLDFGSSTTVPNAILITASAAVRIAHPECSETTFGDYISNKNKRNYVIVTGITDTCKSADVKKAFETELAKASKEETEVKITKADEKPLADYNKCTQTTGGLYNCKSTANADCKLLCDVGTTCTEDNQCGTGQCKGETQKICSGSMLASVAAPILGAIVVGVFGLF